MQLTTHYMQRTTYYIKLTTHCIPIQSTFEKRGQIDQKSLGLQRIGARNEETGPRKCHNSDHYPKAPVRWGHMPGGH